MIFKLIITETMDHETYIKEMAKHAQRNNSKTKIQAIFFREYRTDK